MLKWGGFRVNYFFDSIVDFKVVAIDFGKPYFITYLLQIFFHFHHRKTSFVFFPQFLYIITFIIKFSKKPKGGQKGFRIVDLLPK